MRLVEIELGHNWRARVFTPLYFLRLGFDMLLMPRARTRLNFTNLNFWIEVAGATVGDAGRVAWVGVELFVRGVAVVRIEDRSRE